MWEPMDITQSRPPLARAPTFARNGATCPPVLKEAFERSGWTLGQPHESLPDGVTYGFVARRTTSRRGEPSTTLVFGYHEGREVRLADLWRLVAELNTIRADLGTICLGVGATLSPQAEETAALLKLRVLRVAA
jgi:hypothetical protein